MPRRDGTGAIGFGTRNGKGLGVCNRLPFLGASFCMGFRRGIKNGFCRRTINNQDVLIKTKNLLIADREFYQTQLDMINKQLNNM